MFTYYSLSALINFITTFAIGVFVIIVKRTKVSLTFAIYSFLVAFWSLFYFFWQTSTTHADALHNTRLLMHFAIFIPIAYLTFVYAFLGLLQKKMRFLQLSGVMYFIFLILNLFTDLFVSDVVPRLDFAFWPVPGPMFHIFVVLWMIYVIYPTYLLYANRNVLTGTRRQQSQYMFWGLLISFAGGVTNYLLWYQIPIAPYGNILVPTFVVMTAYAIVRHRFLDIRLFAARSVAYTLLLSSLGVIYAALGLIASVVFLQGQVDYRSLFVYAGITLVIASTFHPFKTLITQYTDKFFYKSAYTPAELLYQLGQTLTTTVAFEETLKNIYDLLNKNLHTKGMVFAVKIKNQDNMPRVLVRSSEFALYTFNTEHIEASDCEMLVRQFEKDHKAVVIDDLRDELANTDNSRKRKTVEWMSKNNIVVILPLLIKNEVMGLILLSHKLSGDSYSAQDMDVLEAFALQAAIGIENVMLFMHSRDFNERLKSEVEIATSQLQQKNKNLEILRKMDSIIMTTLDPKEMSQKIVDTIAWELGYDGAIISIVDYKKSVIIPTAVSKTPLIDKSLKLVPRSISEYQTPLNSEKSLAVQSLMLKTKVITASLADAFEPVLPRIISDGIQKIIGMKGVIIYPIMSKDQPLGVLTLALHKNPHDVTAEEHNILDAFMDEVAIALENAYLYEEARSVNTMLYETNKELVGLDKMKDEFVSIASHELRTPMTAINGYVWMLLAGKGGDLSEKQRYYLERVSQSSQRLINLVNDMLSVSRIESGKVQIAISDFDIVDMVKSVYEELQIKSDEKKLDFSFTSAAPSIKVSGDPDKTREVITNLLGNALKFTDKGSIITTIEEHDQQIRIGVADTGRGVASEDMPKLFKKFGRLDSSLSTVAATTGTGLGLYICKKYVEAMKGTFDVKSELGRGSTFAFSLPKAP